jgi:hypothetical protein
LQQKEDQRKQVSALQPGTEIEARERHLVEANYIKLLYQYKREFIDICPGSDRSANGAILEGCLTTSGMTAIPRCGGSETGRGVY